MILLGQIRNMYVFKTFPYGTIDASKKIPRTLGVAPSPLVAPHLLMLPIDRSPELLCVLQSVARSSHSEGSSLNSHD